MDNDATHKHPKIRAWLARHPRSNFHFTPTSASWLNVVERFFRELTARALRRGVFHSVPDLIASIQNDAASYNNKPSPMVWTAKATDILARISRARQKLVSLHQ